MHEARDYEDLLCWPGKFQDWHRTTLTTLASQRSNITNSSLRWHVDGRCPLSISRGVEWPGQTTSYRLERKTVTHEVRVIRTVRPRSLLGLSSAGRAGCTRESLSGRVTGGDLAGAKLVVDCTIEAPASFPTRPLSPNHRPAVLPTDLLR
jgi:hypothetical protein